MLAGIAGLPGGRDDFVVGEGAFRCMLFMSCPGMSDILLLSFAAGVGAVLGVLILGFGSCILLISWPGMFISAGLLVGKAGFLEPDAGVSDLFMLLISCEGFVG